MSHKMLRPFMVKVSPVLGYFPLHYVISQFSDNYRTTSRFLKFI